MIKLFVFCTVLIACTSCASSGQKTSFPVPVKSAEINPLPEVKPSVSWKIFSPYFKAVKLSVLMDIQDGRPAAIRQAVSALYKPSGKYSEQEHILFAICAAVMKYAWPQEKVTWTVRADLPDNLYTAVLDSVDRGIFAFSSAENDVFMLTLPCLALFSASAVDGFYNEAFSCLEKALEFNPDSVINLYLAGKLSLRTMQYDRAVSFLECAAAIEPDNAYIAAAYTEALLCSGEEEKAYTLSLHFLNLQPQNTEILKLAARSAFAVERYKEAESFAARILQREPDNRDFLLFRSRVLFQLENYLSVSNLLDLYARSDKTSKDYLLLRARLQAVWNKNVDAAISTVQDALGRYKDDTEVLMLAAELAVFSGQTVSSKTAFELASAVLEKEPENVRSLAVLAKDAVKKRDWQNAYRAVVSLSRLETLSLENTLLYVQICLELNKIDQARLLLQDVYNCSMTDEHIQQWYIRLLIAEGKKTEAAALIDSLLLQVSAKMKSVLYYEKSRLSTSDSQLLSDLRSSLTANPRNENALYDLYAYYYRSKDYRKAQYYLKQVIALNPSDGVFLRLNSDLEQLLE